VRALVTGCSGFVGRHMLDQLDRTGWDTAGLDIADSFDALDYFRTGTARWDLVVHAAASAPHRAAIDGEHQHMARNLQLDAAMFEWAVRTGQGRVLYLSSSAAYPIARQTGPGWARLWEDDIDLVDGGAGAQRLRRGRLPAAFRVPGRQARRGGVSGG
jgi:nucleoside-diphosphate-sugar epimerase